MLLHVSSTCVHHQKVKIALHSLWYYHTYRCDDTRGSTLSLASALDGVNGQRQAPITYPRERDPGTI